MKNSAQVWALYRQSKAWATRPSEMLGVSDVYVAYCIDSAVYAFGSALSAELDSIEGKSKEEIKRKRERLVTKWLDMPMKFRNPGMVGPKQKQDEEHVMVRGE